MPHCTSQITPAELLMHRSVKMTGNNNWQQLLQISNENIWAGCNYYGRRITKLKPHIFSDVVETCVFETERRLLTIETEPRLYIFMSSRDLKILETEPRPRQLSFESEPRLSITCKRGSAKHNVKDDHAFLRKHAIFRHLPSRNPSTDRNEITRDWLRRQDYAMCQKWLKSVGWRRPHR
jgi:hypothetical protein